MALFRSPVLHISAEVIFSSDYAGSERDANETNKQALKQTHPSRRAIYCSSSAVHY
jgi:hypothetical protein